MSEPIGFFRTTFSIPTALKVRMDGAKVAIDWSSFVSSAIERKLDELERRPGDAKMLDAADRLRASKAKAEGKGAPAGIAAGKAWAANYAEHPQLMRLAAANASFAADPSIQDFTGWLHSLNETDDLVAGERLAEFIEGRPVSRSAAREFWELTIGYELIECRLNPAFLTGFNEGALSVWESVKDQL